jgi:DNA-binding response OmpR family regulator
MTYGIVYLPSVIEEAIEAVGDYVGEKPISVVAETPAHLPVIEGRSGPLVTVVTSIITHVVRTTKRDQVRVQAGLLSDSDISIVEKYVDEVSPALETRGMWAVVTVSDVPTEVSLSAIHIEDEGAEEGATEDSEIKILSLSSCGEIIKKLGGYVWGEEQQDVGSRFHIALPLQAAGTASTDISHLRRAVDTRLHVEPQLSRTILMLVEKVGLRDLLTNELSEAGYRVLATSIGGEVLPLAKSEHPDLILLDLLARHPLALDVAMVLKRDTRTQGIPVLFLTSVDDPQVGVRMGTIDFVVRTVGTGALLSTINTVLRSGLSPTSRVMIVEPDDALRENMVMMIQAHGYRVIVATTPEEGQALAERVEPELILVNAKLAQERDYWLLRGLRRISEESEIFVLADAFSDEEVRAAMSRGASGYSETGKLPDLLNRVRGKNDVQNSNGGF